MQVRNIALIIALSLSLSACGAVIDASVDESGNAAVVCTASFGTAFMDVMRQINGAAAGAPLMTAEDLQDMASKLRAAGLSGASLRTASPESMEISCRNSKLLFDTGCLAIASLGGKKRMTLTLNAESLHSLYTRLDENVQAYLDLSMAGVFGGEAATKEEWLESLAVVYGKPFADEAAKAYLTVNMSVQGAGGKTTKKTFTLPLSVLLAGQSAPYVVEG